jgi:hypothetical protein
MLWIFIALKNSSTSARFESNGEHVTTWISTNFILINILRFRFMNTDITNHTVTQSSGTTHVKLVAHSLHAAPSCISVTTKQAAVFSSMMEAV